MISNSDLFIFSGISLTDTCKVFKKFGVKMSKPRLSLIMNDKALFTAQQKKKLSKIQNELLQIRNSENLEFKKFMWQLSQRNKSTKIETNE